MTAFSWLADPLLHLNGTGPSHCDAFRAATEVERREHLRVHHAHGAERDAIATQAVTLPSVQLVAAHGQFHITQNPSRQTEGASTP